MNRREQILAVAARLFRERGYNGTNLKLIANETGISKTAIYYHFKAKEDLLYEICHTHLTHMFAQGQSIVESDAALLDKIKNFIEMWVVEYDLCRDRAESWLRESPHLSMPRRKELYLIAISFERMLIDLVDQAIQEKLIRPVNSKIVVRGISGICNWVGNWYRPDGVYDIHTIASEYSSFVMRCYLIR